MQDNSSGHQRNTRHDYHEGTQLRSKDNHFKWTSHIGSKGGSLRDSNIRQSFLKVSGGAPWGPTQTTVLRLWKIYGITETCTFRVSICCLLLQKLLKKGQDARNCKMYMGQYCSQGTMTLLLSRLSGFGEGAARVCQHPLKLLSSTERPKVGFMA